MEAVELGAVSGERISIAAAERDVSVALADAERAWRSLAGTPLIQRIRRKTGRLEGCSGDGLARRSLTSRRHQHPLRRRLGAHARGRGSARGARPADPAAARQRELRLLGQRNGQDHIGRAKINGTGVNNNFITGLDQPAGVAVDSKYIYWTQGSATPADRPRQPGRHRRQSELHHHAAVIQPLRAAPRSPSTSGIFWQQHGQRYHRASQHRRQQSRPAPSSATGPDPDVLWSRRRPELRLLAGYRRAT